MFVQAGTLLHVFGGHYDEVSALTCIPSFDDEGYGAKSSGNGHNGTTTTTGPKKRKPLLISTGLDGTIRRWRLARVREAQMTARKLIAGTDEWDDGDLDGGTVRTQTGGEGVSTVGGRGGERGAKEKKKGEKSLLTEEEERELAELMDEDD